MLISVITPVYRPREDFLADAYESLCDQSLPSGWEWEWLIQVDGEDELPLPRRAMEDARVKPSSGPHGGPGMARNLALERSAGTLIQNLDADDILCPNALARNIEIFTKNPEVGWTTSRALDLMPDGRLVRVDADRIEGRITRGVLAEEWWLRGYTLTVHPATICIRRELVIAVGGWMALPVGEDIGMLLAVSTFAPGWFIGEVGLHYRKHPGQTTPSDTPKDVLHKRWLFLKERVLAIEAVLSQPNIRWMSAAEWNGGSSGL
ncbi:glycosyltransferase family 2 protein [Nocardia blacklockiae]|uniref:glycosyltransferase family 2 protein n=1 Tax=Nocardia blacklockiae TaxID=480036 RepID=UPI001895CCD8|nr:glycosyltransferase [Nocardia blacklockiae]MBF6171532.1 glycosyltransferase [Nocardia blacklockiae]